MAKGVNQIVNNIRLGKLRRVLDQINALSEKFSNFSNEALQAKTKGFKVYLNDDKASLNHILLQAYATVREASKRVLGMYPKDVQILGAIAMHQGNVAEMQTGEGKTLTATIPLYLNALTGKGAYPITTNDYLAKHDSLEVKPLYEWLGLSVSLGFVDISGYEYAENEKYELYHHDIVYTTNGRLGFDYLIDNLADDIRVKFLPKLNFAIIDEVDSIILGAAQTPLVISGAPRVQSNLSHIVKKLVETLEKGKDFIVSFNKKEMQLTNEGSEKASHYFKVNSIHQQQYLDLVRMTHLSLRAKYLFKYNLGYFIFDGEIVLIDRITGRMLPGTKLRSGLHQAIGALENVEISQDMDVMATITFQNLFKQFDEFSGMTRTGKLEEKEFFNLYSKVVIEILTHSPIEWDSRPDRVLTNGDRKNNAILKTAIGMHETQQPVLLITRTAEAAKYFSAGLFKRDIPNNLLIAQDVAKEAQIIAEAGQLSAVTVATSMAGRGTDIELSKEVHDIGGLAVIINEYTDNSRVDRQLRGRSGRQGDPGYSQILVSLDDDLVKRWSNSNLAENKNLQTMYASRLESSTLFKKRVESIVNKAQRVFGETAMKNRETASEFEKSISARRDKVYAERNRIPEASDLDDFNFEQLARDVFTKDVKNLDLSSERVLVNYIYGNLSLIFDEDVSNINMQNDEGIIQFLIQQFTQQFNNRLEVAADLYSKLRFIQKSISKAIDSKWIEQVDNLQQLKANVNNRQNGQRNVIFEYHKVTLETYEYMSEDIKRKMVKNLCLSILAFNRDEDMVIHFP